LTITPEASSSVASAGLFSGGVSGASLRPHRLESRRLRLRVRGRPTRQPRPCPRPRPLPGSRAGESRSRPSARLRMYRRTSSENDDWNHSIWHENSFLRRHQRRPRASGRASGRAREPVAAGSWRSPSHGAERTTRPLCSGYVRTRDRRHAAVSASVKLSFVREGWTTFSGSLRRRRLSIVEQANPLKGPQLAQMARAETRERRPECDRESMK
jgi:hypothetical protein